MGQTRVHGRERERGVCGECERKRDVCGEREMCAERERERERERGGYL